MRKKISDIYSKTFPKKSGEEYTTKELILVVLGWTAAIALLFVVLKFMLDRFHLE